MTIASTVKRNQYLGDGSQTQFPYQFRILSDSDVSVYLLDNGEEVLQVLNTDYSVTGVSDVGGGNVVFNTAPSSNVVVTIVRDSDALQQETYVENDSFPAASHEIALDRAAIVSQSKQEQVDRAIKVRASTNMTSFDTTLPFITPEMGGYLVAVKADATGFELVPFTPSPIPPDPNSLGALSDVSLFGLAAGHILRANTTSSWANIAGNVSGSYQPYNENISTVNEAEVRSANINMTTNRIDNADFRSWREEVQELTTTSIDILDGNVLRFDHDDDLTLSFVSPAVAGHVAFTLIRFKDATANLRTITWPAAVKWPDGTEPVLTQTPSAVDVFYFRTVDGGTTWFGFANKNLS